MKIFKILKYIQIVPLFEGNKNLFFIIFYSIIFLLVLVALNIIYIMYSIYKNKTIYTPLLNTLKIIPYITNPFYFPILLFLLSLLSCDEKKMNAYVDMKCWSGIHFFHSIIGVIFAFLLFFMSFNFISIFYDNKFTSRNINAKASSKQDKLYIIMKTVLIIIFTKFSDDSSNPNKQWLRMVVLNLFSTILLVNYLVLQNYYNHLIMTFYKCLPLLFS